MFSHASVILSTIGLMAIRSLLILVTARSVRILLDCFLVMFFVCLFFFVCVLFEFFGVENLLYISPFVCLYLIDVICRRFVFFVINFFSDIKIMITKCVDQSNKMKV